MNAFTIDRQKLYDEIWDISARKVSEKYGISYTRLLAKCRECDIPLPPSGYFTKRQFGKPITQTPLPKSDIQIVTIESPSSGKAAKEPPTIQVSEITGEMIPIDQEQHVSSGATDEIKDLPMVPLGRYVHPQQALREELFNKVWERPISEVSKEYGVSNVSLRKRCIKLDVPVPERGYWAKLKAGKPVSRPTVLPVIQQPSHQKSKTGDQRELHIRAEALSFMQEDGRREILSLAAKLEVGGLHSKMLDSIEEMDAKCKEWHKKDVYGFYPARNYRYAEEPFLANTMTPKCFSRAFHIIDALLKALQPYNGRLDDKNRLIVNGEPILFTMKEGKDDVPHEITPEERLQLLKYEEERKINRHAYKPRIPKFDHPWNRRLCMTINGKYTFEDCDKYMLEDRIGGILIAFFEASYDERLKRLEREDRQRQEYEEYLRKEKARETYNQEVKRTKALANEAADYAIACQIRTFIAQIEQSPNNPKNNPQWLEWAKAKADWYDPTVSKEDAYFGKRQHEADPSAKDPAEKKWW